MKIEVNIEKKYAYAIFGLLILGIGIFAINAYGTPNPAVFGHSAGEIEGVCRTDGTGCVAESDPTVLASVKDGISWGEISSIPSGFADGVDDVGGSEWSSQHGSCYTLFVATCCSWGDCAAGYVVTGVYPSAGGWGTLHSIRCCKIK